MQETSSNFAQSLHRFVHTTFAGSARSSTNLNDLGLVRVVAMRLERASDFFLSSENKVTNSAPDELEILGAIAPAKTEAHAGACRRLTESHREQDADQPPSTRSA